MTLGTWIAVAVVLVVVAGTAWEMKRPKKPRKFSQPERDPDLSPADQRTAELRREELTRNPPPPYRPKRPRRADGMTWTALVVLVGILALAGAEAWLWADSRKVPDGVEAVEATVVDRSELSSRPMRTVSPDFEEIRFVTEDGREGSALYEKRWIAAHDKGDTITVYPSPDDDREWQTTAEESWGALGGIVLGLLFYGLLLLGWFRVRRREGLGSGQRG